MLEEVIAQEGNINENTALKKYESKNFGQLDLNFDNKNKQDLQTEVLLLNVLNRSISNCEVEQRDQFQDQVASKFDHTQFKLLDILKTSIFNQEYDSIIQIKKYIEKAGLLDMVESIYLESLVGNMQLYGIAEKESNIGELTRYYFILSRLIQNLDS
jgi:hypothetical protein